MPVAQACGPPLLPASQGGPPEFSTLCEALDHTARHAPADCGITYVSRGRSVFESYAALRAGAGTMLGALRALGLAPRGVVALQLLERSRRTGMPPIRTSRSASSRASSTTCR